MIFIYVEDTFFRTGAGEDSREGALEPRRELGVVSREPT